MENNKAFGELALIFPTEDYKEQVEEFLQEHFDNNEFILHGDGGLDTFKDFDIWLDSIRRDRSKETVDEWKVPSTVFLGVRRCDNKIVGIIQIRHELNDYLLKYGGHIGDSVRPSERGKGYATEMIRLALKECQKLGIVRVLMTCGEDNFASRKSIINNGGVLENVYWDEENLPHERYWIEL